MACAALHENPDHVLGFRSEVRLSVGRCPDVRGLGGAQNALFFQNGAEREPHEAHAAVRQECPATDIPAETGLRDSWFEFHRYSLSNGHKFRMVQQRVDKIFTRP